MTHEAEASFHDHVGALLRDSYGPANVSSEHYFRQTGNYADFVVDHPLGTACVEIENDADSIRNGVGQAIEYAGTHVDPNATPVVVVPADHVNYPEIEAIRERIPIIELDY